MRLKRGPSPARQSRDRRAAARRSDRRRTEMAPSRRSCGSRAGCTMRSAASRILITVMRMRLPPRRRTQSSAAASMTRPRPPFCSSGSMAKDPRYQTPPPSGSSRTQPLNEFSGSVHPFHQRRGGGGGKVGAEGFARRAIPRKIFGFRAPGARAARAPIGAVHQRCDRRDILIGYRNVHAASPASPSRREDLRKVAPKRPAAASLLPSGPQEKARSAG